MTKVLQPTWNELPAKHLRKGRMKVVGCVLHDTAGNGGHGDTLYLANPGDGRVVSVDFTVEKDGSIWKLNPDLKKYFTLHAGRATRFKDLRNGDVTRSTIGIEITQHYDIRKVNYPPEQVKSVARLCAWLCQEFYLNPADVTTHRNIVTDGSRSDPRYFPFDDFWLYFNAAKGQGNEYVASLGIKKTPDDKPNHVVKSGESFYAIARAHSITPEELAKVNRLTLSSVLLPGQVLTLPAKG